MKTEIKEWSGGATVRGHSLEACWDALRASWVSSRDSGALRISGERTPAGVVSIVVRLANPRIPYLPERLPVESEVRAAAAACDRAMAAGEEVRVTAGSDGRATWDEAPRG